MEGMRNPLDAVKNQRDMGFEGLEEINEGSPNRNSVVLSPMSMNESDGSDESDAGGDSSLRTKPNGRIKQRNLNPPDWNGGGGRNKTMPLTNGEASSVFNHTLKEIDPVLKQDQVFQDEMHKLNQLYEAKLASLQAAHEESRRKIIISAMVRNKKGVDVKILMESAATRRDVDIKSKNVYKQAADSECFKVMLDSMSPNSGRDEFDDIVKTKTTGGEQVIQELNYEEDDYEQANGDLRGSARSQSSYTRQTSKSSKSDSEYEISVNLDLEDPPIAVSPTERNGKHETVF